MASGETNTENDTYKFVKKTFGTSIAENLRPGQEKITSVNQIGDKYIHAALSPIYKALLKYELSVSDWALILSYILSSQQIPRHKLGTVFKNVYHTLTGKNCEDDTYRTLLDSEEKALWLDSFAERVENYNTKEASARHLRECIALAQGLSQWASEKGIDVPSVNSAEFLVDLDLHQLAKQHSPLPHRKFIPNEDDSQHINPYLSLKEELEIANTTTKETTGVDHIPPTPSAPPQIFGFNRPPTYFESTSSNIRQMMTSDSCKMTSESCSDVMEEGVERQRHGIRIIDFLPNKFNPAKSESDPEAHILGFRDYLCAQLGYTSLKDKQIAKENLDMFRFTLAGEARLWYESLAPFNKISQLEEDFLREFAPDLRSRTTAAKALADLKYDRKSKLCSFVNKITRLNRTLGYDDSVLKDRFLAAMPSDIRRLARVSQPEKFSDAVAIVKRILEDEETTHVSFAIQKEDDINGTIVDMAMSIQSLKSEVDKIAQNMRSKTPDRNQNRHSDRRNRSESRERYPQRDVAYSPRRRYDYSPQRRNDFSPNRPNYDRRNQSNYQKFRDQPQRGRARGGRQYMVPQRRLDRTQIRCFGCNSLGHIQKFCRRLGNNRPSYNQGQFYNQGPQRQTRQYEQDFQ